MGGGLMQLVAYGAQDIYLTGNPQITFFKVVYRRHTNFAVESIEQTHNGSVAAGSKISVTVSRNGDLLSQVWLSMVGDGNAGGALAVDTLEKAHAAIDNVECEVGGQVIDKQYGDWMSIFTDLTHNTDQLALLTKCATGGTAASPSMIPLQFWFCRNPGLALPLIALQYHEVKLNVTFSSVPPTSVDVWCDYVFLDTDERRRFAQVSHEYLIEQVQFSNKLNVDGTNPQNELRFNHPVKELVWTVTSANVGTGTETVTDALLQLNGHDRFKRRVGKYFTDVQRYQHHTGSGGDGNIHVYSFGLKPEEHQPSGTCNFSRIDNAVLNLTLSGAGTTAGSSTGGSLKVYAVNYNVLRIMSGMGGLAYSN